jgi:hypothetical protein
MGGSAAKTRSDGLFWIALVGILVAFFTFQLNHIEQFSWNDDEGIYMVEARLLGSGYRLYSEIFSPSPPLFIVSLRWAFALLGASAQAARTVIVVYSTIGLLAVALIAREMKGWLAGFSALVLLAITPDFFLLSRVCIGDIPAISVATLAILMALRYYQSGHRTWLALAGVITALSLLLKLLSAFAVPLLALMVVLRYLDFSPLGRRVLELKQWRAMLTDLAWLGLTCLLPILGCMLVYEVRPMYEDILLFHWQARDASQQAVIDNLKAIGAYLLENKGLCTLGLYGIAMLPVKSFQQSVFLPMWFLLAVLMLTNHTPLHDHHLSLLLFPLSVSGGVAIAYIGQWFSAPVSRMLPKRRGLIPLVAGVCSLVIYFVDLPAAIEVNGASLNPLGQERHSDAAHFLGEITKPQDFVVTDALMLAFVADRKVPPALADTSMTRIRAGYLTLDQLMTATREYDVQAIAIWGERFPDLMPEYVEWVKEHYQLAKFLNQEHQVYLARGVPPPPELTLGGKVILAGVTPNNLQMGSDNRVHLTLHWSALQKMAEDYAVYLKLVNSVYHVWGEQDSRPCWDGCPTNAWHQGQVIHDQREIEVLPGTPPGTYWIEVLLHDLHSGQWTGPEDGSSLRLGPVEIPRREPPPISSLDIAHPLEIGLGGKIRLLGYNIESGFRPGDNVHLTLFWQCLEPVGENYTVFTHLVDEESHILAQKDNPPADGFYPTTKWEPGEVMRDQYDLIIPQDVSGDWELKIGMYNAETGQRLSAVAGEEPLPDNAVVVWP